jgi:hypothetical protein
MVGSARAFALLAVVLAGAPAAAAVHDATVDFTPGSASGLWSYGFGQLGSSFTLATVGSECVSGIACWQPPVTVLNTPLVGKNTTGATLGFATGWIPNDRLLVQPGQGLVVDEDAIVRFTAPTSGVYSFAGAFGLIGFDATGVNVEGWGPTGRLFFANLPNPSPGFEVYGSEYSFSGTVSLAAGQFADFGVDNAGAFNGDGTMMALTIERTGSLAVPEPSSWAMLIAGFGLIGATLRRRRLAAI